MTGFGSGEAAARHDGGKLLVELRALNHRFLEVRVRSPELGDLTSVVEPFVRERFTRGRIEVVVHGEGLRASAPMLDRDRARSAYRDLAAMRDELAPGEPVPLSLLSAVPDLFVTREGSPSLCREALEKAFHAAAADLDAMREREGAALAREMQEHLRRALAVVTDIEARAPETLAATHKRLRERVARLTSSAEPVDAARLEQEIAILADRSDVAEELARLRSHCEQLAQVLSSDGPIGRRIDFLLQEMTREVNTIGSKSADVGIARSVVELKLCIERLREQTQNVE
jgi:uncharacterized protein (TIGR00255 family)